MQNTTDLYSAFAEWMETDNDRFEKLWAATDPVDDRIGLSMHRFTRYLSVSLSPTGVTVAVKWDGECWDLLFDDDLVARRTAAGEWHCKLCPRPRTKFARIEDLWIDHLFAPLADWIERALMPARALFLCEIKGVRWASLTDGVVIAPHARYAVFEDIGGSGDQ